MVAEEKIVLTQIKQDFTTPVDAISDYINLIIDGSDVYDEISDEFQNIKKSAKTLRQILTMLFQVCRYKEEDYFK